MEIYRLKNLYIYTDYLIQLFPMYLVSTQNHN